MEVILVTGLDGAGKSSVFSKLEEYKTKEYETLLVPQINTSGLEENSMLFTTASFINELGKEADHVNSVQLKAIALFSSMLLFRNLLKHKSAICKKVFCERHPLVDTIIYAHFYAEKLGPVYRNMAVLNELDTQNPNQLAYIVSQLPKEMVNTQKGMAVSLLDLIYTWFHIDKNFTSEKLKELFQIELPNKIFYLKAKPEILYNRIKNREYKEAHESLEVLRKLHHVYNEVLNNIPVPVLTIDTTEPSSINKLIQQLVHSE